MTADPVAAPQPISFGRRLSLLAEQHPAKPAIVFVRQDRTERSVPWRELDRRSNQLARRLQAMGVGDTSLVAIGLPNCPEHFIAAYAAWKLGALVLPVRYSLPDRERDGILAVGQPSAVIADWHGVAFPLLNSRDLEHLAGDADAPVPDRVPHPGKSIGSGGSTGRSKIIVDPRPWARVPGDLDIMVRSGFRPHQVHLVTGPLYHNTPFSWSHYGLFEDQTLILMEHFDAALAVDLIERYRVNWLFLAPTMARRIAQLPGVERRDFSSIEGVFQTAAPTPPYLKRWLIETIGADKIYEGFGSTEAIGATTIRGDEWLEHPGSVGRPSQCEMKILDEHGGEVPVGTVGEIFFRPFRTEPTYSYIGSPPVTTTPDGFMSVGDLGWVDEQGYLFLADRRVDLIITGAANVYPAEVEAAIGEHPGVGDVVVIGVPDEEWGKRVHAIVVPRDPAAAPSPEALDAFCRQRIAAYKVPKTYEYAPELPRDTTGKIRRSSLVDERAHGDTPAMLRPRRS